MNQHDGAAADFLVGGGEMGKLIREKDWSQTPLGPIENWPQSLKTTVSLCLASNFPISLTWGDRQVQIYNDGYLPICGEKHPGSLGQDFRECWASAWPAVGEAFERALQGETRYLENQRMFLDRNGYLEETFFTFSFSPVRDETGEVGGLFHPVTETTGRMLSERRTRALHDLAARTGHATSVSEALRLAAQVLEEYRLDVPFSVFYEISEGSHATLTSGTGVRMGSSAAPDHVLLEEHEGPWHIAEVARTGRVVELDDVPRRLGDDASGPYPEAPQNALVFPIAAGGERPQAFAVLGVSARLALTDAYRAFYDLLANALGASVTAARAYDQERRRAEALAELDRAKTTFFSNVSHELRTPLTLILGPVEDAMRRKTPRMEGPELELVRRSALRLYKMVNTLLDFSRMEAGRAEASFAPTDLATFTVNLASSFRSLAESAGLELHVSCPQLSEPIYVDQEMWEKVVLNLLSNALKYTHDGHITVELSESARAVTLRVRDTGVGIPEPELPRVFERFHRVRGTHGRSHEGTGIGLALVKELIELHGGTVEVVSRPGAGSTFAVCVPKGLAHLPPESIDQASARLPVNGAVAYVEEARRWLPSAELAAPLAGSPAPALPENLAGCEVLVVDDNADLRSYVVSLLQRVYPNVTTANDGLEALERARQKLPDVIVSDVMMPKLDGLGLVQALRADERTRGVPIILLSARAGAESSVEGLESGADDYLVKPFSGRELLARVRTQLEMVHMRRELTRQQLTEAELRSTLEARDEWLTVVSHELRTPLSALSLSVESLSRSLPAALRGGADSDKATDRLRSVNRHMDRMTAQVGLLVDAAALTSGQADLELQLGQVDLAELLRDVSQCVKETMRSGRHLELHAPEPIIGVYDSGRLRQLFAGILDNAVKFGRHRLIQIHVERRAREAVVRVADHGAGIPIADRQRLFERFQRAAPANHFGGFGLGLWMARQIAQAHGGDVELSETPNGGTTVTVSLPMPDLSLKLMNRTD